MKTIFALLMVALALGYARPPAVPIKLLQGITSDRYPDANGVIVFDSTQVTVAANGTATTTSHRLVKLLTSFGKKKFGDMAFSYCSLYDTVIVEQARVIGADGKIYPLAKSEIKDVPMPAAEGSKLFLPNVRLKKITFAHLEAGAAIEIISRDELRHPPRADNFDAWDIFASDEPIREKTYTISAPAAMDLHWQVRNGELTFSKKEKNNRITYQWEARNVDRIIQEPAMPSLPDVTTKLLVATEPDFRTWSKWYYELAKPSFAIDSVIEAKVRALTRDKKTDEEKIRALYYFVSQEIRYLETRLTGRYGGYEPARAPTTFTNRYGVCRDKAALLVGMLEAIGVDAYIVLTNPLFEVDKAVAVDQFNHAIVAIKRPDGSYYYLDPTAEESRDYLVPIEMNKAVLVCTPAGEDLSRTPFVPAEKNMFFTQADASLNAAGDIEGKMVMKPAGFFDFAFRTSFKQIPPDQRKQMLEMIAHAISPNAEMTSFNISDIKNLDNPLTMELSYRAADYGIKVEDELNFEMPGGNNSGLGASMGGQSTPWSLASRKYPLYFWSTLSSGGTETVTIPAGYRIKHLPDSLNADYDRFAFHLSYRVNKNKIIRQTDFVIKDPLIPVSDYGDFRSLMQKIEDVTKQSITLVKPK
jgi:transglutaminase-like putative cysteine protease